MDQLNRIMQTLTKAAQGDFSHRVEATDAPDPLGPLTEAVNAVIESLRHKSHECRRLEEALETATEKYCRLKANIPGMVYLFIRHSDGSFAFPYVNSGSRMLFDVEPQDLMRDWALISGLIHPDDRERFESSVMRSAETVHPWREEIRHIVKGETRWYDCMSQPERLPNGDVLWSGIILETTGRKRAELRLKQSEERFRSLVQSVAIVIVLLSHDWKIVEFNLEAEKLYGLGREEVLGRDCSVLFPSPEECESMKNRAAKALAGEQPREFESLVQAKDGRKRAVSWNVSRLESTEDEPAGLVVAGQDVTQRKKVERELRRSEKKLRNIISASPVGIAMYDASGQCISTNDSMARIIGTTRERVLEQNYNSIESWQRSGLLDEVRAAVGGRAPRRCEIVTQSSFGKQVSLDCHLVPFGARGLLLMVQDITERKNREMELKRFQFSVEQAPDAVYWITQEGSFSYVNKQACRMLGYTREEFGRLRLWDVNPNFSKERWDALWAQYQDDNHDDTFHAESFHRRKDGVLLPIEVSARHFWFGETDFHVAFVRDISERRRVEQELNLTQSAIERASIACFWITENGRFFYVNEQACRSLGYTREEFLSMSVADIDPDFSPEMWVSFWERYARTQVQIFETTHRRKDGSLFPVEITANHIEFGGREYSCAYSRDITERKKAEEEKSAHLRFLESMERVDRVMRKSLDFDEVMSHVLEEVLSIFHCDRAWLIHPCDPDASSWRVSMERTVPAYPGSPTLNVDMPMGLEAAQVFRAALDSEDPVSVGPEAEKPVLFPNTVLCRYQSQISVAVYPRQGRPWLLGLHQCSHPRVWTEEEAILLKEIGRRIADALTSLLMFHGLRESEEKYRSVVDNTNLGIALIGPDMKVLAVNNRLKDLYRSSDFQREPLCYAAFNYPPRSAPCEYCAAVHTFRDGTVHTTVTETPTAEGIKHLRVISSPIKDGAGSVTAVIELVDDITESLRAEAEKEKLEAQLTQAQKMEAIGTLAGGIAHDFNNMIGVILGYADLIKSRLPINDPLLKDIAEIERAANRSKDTTRQLLAFSRKQIIAPRTVDLNDHISDFIRTLSRLIGENIDLSFVPAPGLWKTRFDPSQLDQILVNLAVNARDALPDGGKLTLQTSNAMLDETYCHEHIDCVPGEYVLLTVSDNGSGMDQETLSRIFEPFFTTKEEGKGTGLGLATVYGIVRQNNGAINVYSEPEMGTTFKLYFPRIERGADAVERAERATETSGTGTVLLVEDDEMVRRMARSMLEKIGYTVLVAETPLSAISICKNEEQPIDVLLTDLVMPGMSGKELKQKLEEIRPGIKALFMSGYTSNIIVHHGVLEDGVNFIQKPFSLKELSQKLREAMAESDRL